MRLEARLKQLEGIAKSEFDENCICFPADEPPSLQLDAERAAVAAVVCPLHGKRFKDFAPVVYRALDLPDHVRPERWSSHSAQYLKAMRASFPPDRWPAGEVRDLPEVIRWVLKDGTQILQVSLQQINDYNGGEPILHNGEPGFIRRIKNVGRR